MERSRNPAKTSLQVFQFVAAMVFLHVVAGAPTASPKCSGKPADVFFVMDASASIWAPDFRKQLIFVQDVIKEFDFNDGNTRVGAMTFGDYPYLQFTFDTHTKQSAILKAVQETWQTGGNTKTAEALRYMRDLVTTSARPDVARVVIVITDGESHDAVATAREAALARASGIHLMAIGVGSAVIHKELEAIANEPAKENVFTVDNYDALENIRGLLAIKTCTAPVIEHLPANTVEERRYGDQTLTTSAPSKSQSRDCKQKPADIVFVADSSSSIWDDDFQKQLNFIETIVKDFDISSEQTRIGMITFSDHGHHEFHLNTFTNSGDILNAVSSTKQTLGETNTADALRKMRKAFSVKHGGRPGVVPQIAIVMTDGRSNDPVLTVFEAGQAHRHNIHVFAIGIGGDVDKQELSSITNSPTDQHVFQVDSFKALTTIKELLASKTCAVKEQESGKTKAPPINDQAGCGRDGKADIIFAIPGAMKDKETTQTLNFIRKFTGAFHISHHGIRIGLAPRTCNALPGFDLDEYPSSIELQTSLQYKIDSLKPVQDSKAARMLRYMRTEGFRHTHGGRNHVKKIAVLFIDHTSKDSEIDIIAGEVQKLRRHHNIDMYVVGVGKGVSQGVLETIASHPLSRFISTVSNYGDLDSVKDSLSQHICLSL